MRNQITPPPILKRDWGLLFIRWKGSGDFARGEYPLQAMIWARYLTIVGQKNQKLRR